MVSPFSFSCIFQHPPICKLWYCYCCCTWKQFPIKVQWKKMIVSLIDAGPQQIHTTLLNFSCFSTWCNKGNCIEWREFWRLASPGHQNRAAALEFSTIKQLFPHSNDFSFVIYTGGRFAYVLVYVGCCFSLGIFSLWYTFPLRRINKNEKSMN